MLSFTCSPWKYGMPVDSGPYIFIYFCRSGPGQIKYALSGSFIPFSLLRASRMFLSGNTDRQYVPSPPTNAPPACQHPIHCICWKIFLFSAFQWFFWLIAQIEDACSTLPLPLCLCPCLSTSTLASASTLASLPPACLSASTTNMAKSAQWRHFIYCSWFPFSNICSIKFLQFIWAKEWKYN